MLFKLERVLDWMNMIEKYKFDIEQSDVVDAEVYDVEDSNVSYPDKDCSSLLYWAVGIILLCILATILTEGFRYILIDHIGNCKILCN